MKIHFFQKSKIRAAQVTISGSLSSFSPDWYIFPVVSADNWAPKGQASSGEKSFSSRSLKMDDSYIERTQS